MRKFLLILFLSIILLITDTLVSGILGSIYTCFEKKSIDFYTLNISLAIFITSGVTRFIYYNVFFIILFYCFKVLPDLKNKLLQLMIINFSSYILITMFYAFVLNPRYAYYLEPLIRDLSSNPLFYIILLSTMFSPLILNKIPCFEKLITKI